MPYSDQAAQNAAKSKWQRERSRKHREILWEAKKKPCADCGVEYPPYVMDFDHVRGDKVKGLAAMVSHYGEEALRAEIAKCDVVCANCHRERTFGGKIKEAPSEFQI